MTKWEVNKTTTFEGKEIYAIHTYPEPTRIQRVADVFTEANAQLIAAAPLGDELANAVLDMDYEDYDDFLALLEIARRFKAKAEGEKK